MPTHSKTCQRREHWKSRKEGFRSRWKRHIVVNSMQARLRAQLGDRSKYSGERRRRSVVVASIVLTITDPLRGSYPFWYYLQAALIRSCGASFACMELTIISRFQRLQASTSNHKPKGRFFWFVIYKLSLWLFSDDWKKSRRDLMCVGRYAAKVMRNERSEMEHNRSEMPANIA